MMTQSENNLSYIIMCRSGFHKFCNCQYEPNQDIDNFVIEFTENLPRKVQRNLKLIQVRRGYELDFLYHQNGIIHKMDYYVMDLFYNYHSKRRSYSIKFKLDQE